MILQIVKPESFPADAFLVESLPTFTLLLVLGISLAAVLSILYSVAGHLVHESRVHELRVRVSEIRRNQAERLRQLAEDAGSGAFVVAEPADAEGPDHVANKATQTR